MPKAAVQAPPEPAATSRRETRPMEGAAKRATDVAVANGAATTATGSSKIRKTIVSSSTRGHRVEMQAYVHVTGKCMVVYQNR